MMEKPHRRAIYRALFDRIVAENGEVSPPQASHTVLRHNVQNGDGIAVAALAGTEQPPAYTSTRV